MHRMKTFTRALVAALAIAAIAAPASSARPIDLNTPQPEETPAQSDVFADPTGPIYWSYDYEAGRPQERSAGTGGDTPWMIIGLSVAGACLLVGGAVVVSRSHGRARRARIAA
jgi:hypothetical protein